MRVDIMPKMAKDVEDKIIELIDQEFKDSEISRKLSVHRTTVAKRREAYLKQKPDTKNPELEPEKNIQQEHVDSHPLDSQIYKLMRMQGIKTREIAISQAIETQNAFNPFVLNHGMSSPKELVKFFEDELRGARANVEDMNVDMNIWRALHSDRTEEIIALKAEAESQYDVGYDEGEKDYALIVYCTSCGQPITLTPGNETHRRIVKFCRDIGIIHSDCTPKYRRVYA